VRVIGGDAKGHPLKAPDSRSVRPTADRVREAIFDVLASLDVISGASVLDLFAGSGALGIEALSRGAERATFVDANRRCVAVIEANLRQTKLYQKALTEVVLADAPHYLATHPAAVDIAFCDPPYDFSGWPLLLEGLDAGLVVIESNREIDLGARHRLHRLYRYGSTLVTVAFAKSSLDVGGS
jgi:16S rRNA (guanine966-N2)-methyltransferase